MATEKYNLGSAAILVISPRDPTEIILNKTKHPEVSTIEVRSIM